MVAGYILLQTGVQGTASNQSYRPLDPLLIQTRWRLPQDIETRFQAGEIKDINCAAFGATADCYFLSYVNKESVTMFRK